MAASVLAVAIERRNWTLAALCLLVGVTEAASQLPPEALENLLDLLEVRPRAAGEGAKTLRRRRPAKRRLAREFYSSALDEAERLQLEAAAELEGLDEEIAVLRTKLRTALTERPEDVPLMLRGIELLVKAVSARYRLSKEESEDLSENIGRVIEGVGRKLMPESFAHE